MKHGSLSDLFLRQNNEFQVILSLKTSQRHKPPTWALIALTLYWQHPFF